MLQIVLIVLAVAYCFTAYCVAAWAFYTMPGKHRSWFEWVTLFIAPVVLLVTLIFISVESAIAFIKSLSKKCDHRFNSKEVYDWNTEADEIKCVYCKKNFGTLRNGKRARYIDAGAGLHGMMFMKMILIIVLCVSCSHSPKIHSEHKSFLPADSGKWILIGSLPEHNSDFGCKTYYRFHKETNSYIFWSVCVGTGYSSSISAR